MLFTGDKELIALFQKAQRQAPYQVARALTETVFEVRKEIQGKIPQWVNTTRPFLAQSVLYERATPQNMTATVGFAKRADFAKLLEDGGTRTPTGRAISVPIDAPRTAKGGVSRANKPRQILSRKNVFTGKSAVKKTPGIWQKTAKNPFKLLYVFKDATQYKGGHIHFHATAQAVMRARVVEKLDAALARLLTL